MQSGSSVKLKNISAGFGGLFWIVNRMNLDYELV